MDGLIAIIERDGLLKEMIKRLLLSEREIIITERIQETRDLQRLLLKRERWINVGELKGREGWMDY